MNVTLKLKPSVHAFFTGSCKYNLLVKIEVTITRKHILEKVYQTEVTILKWHVFKLGHKV